MKIPHEFGTTTESPPSGEIVLTTSSRNIGGAATLNINLADANFTKTTFDSTVTDVSYSVTSSKQVLEAVSTNQSVLSQPDPSEPSKFIYQSAGSSGIEVTLDDNEKLAKKATTTITTPSPTYFQNNFLEGSLAKHIADQTYAFVDDSTSPPDHYQIYSTYNFTDHVYVKNTDFWADGLDFSGMSVGIRSVTAITSWHGICAAHYAPSIGDSVRFCDSNNDTITRTISKVYFYKKPILSGLVWTKDLEEIDLCIVKFNEALPNDIKKYKFMPTNWRDYLPANMEINQTELYSGESAGNRLNVRNVYPESYRNIHGLNVPAIVTSHYRWGDWSLQRNNRYAFITNSFCMFNPLFVNWMINCYQDPQLLTGQDVPNINNYNGSGTGSLIFGGDSGSPCFYIINNDLVYVGGWLVVLGFAQAPVIGEFTDKVQELIDKSGAEGQTIQTVDLSEFTDFSE